MRTFLYLNLTATEQLQSYQQPDVQAVKAHCPDVAILDLDAVSDELLIHYAKRMMQEATQIIVCIKADESASFRILMGLLEDLMQVKSRQLILLRGENRRLQRVLEARPQLSFKQLNSETAMLDELNKFFFQSGATIGQSGDFHNH